VLGLRSLIAALCVTVVASVAACSRDGAPSSLFNAAGYHVRGDTVYYLNAFPGSAFQVEAADAVSFDALDGTYARDKSTVFVDSVALAGADAATFQLLDRPGFAKDARHAYQRDHPTAPTRPTSNCWTPI
jgi:hypothetical protein